MSARAYGLFPDVDRESSSLEGVCGTIVEEAFAEVVEKKNFLLTEEGQLTSEKQSVIIPTQVLDIWAPEQATALLDEKDRPPLSQHIEAADRRKLLRWGVVDEIDKQQLLRILQQNHLPEPKTWRQLLNLWAYVAPEITSYRHYLSAKNVRIVDVEPFVHGRWDREITRPLLDLLGVRSTLTGPDRLLDCLRALAQAEKPPVHEVEKCTAASTRWWTTAR